MAPGFFSSYLPARCRRACDLDWDGFRPEGREFRYIFVATKLPEPEHPELIELTRVTKKSGLIKPFPHARIEFGRRFGVAEVGLFLP